MKNKAKIYIMKPLMLGGETYNYIGPALLKMRSPAVIYDKNKVTNYIIVFPFKVFTVVATKYIWVDELRLTRREFDGFVEDETIVTNNG